jgi:hypothetical protein
VFFLIRILRITVSDSLLQLHFPASVNGCQEALVSGCEDAVLVFGLRGSRSPVCLAALQGGQAHRAQAGID